jgi:WD40 repeat protein
MGFLSRGIYCPLVASFLLLLVHCANGRHLDYSIKVSAPVTTLASSLNGGILAVGMEGRRKDAGGGLCLLDTKTQRILRRLDASSAVLFVAFSFDGGRLLSVTGPSWSASSAYVSVWNTHTGKRLWRAPSNWADGCWSIDGRRVALCHGRCVEVRDGQSGRILSTLSAPGAGFDFDVVAWSPDGDTLAVGRVIEERPEEDSASGEVLLWNVRMRRWVGRTKLSRSAVAHLAFSPNGKSLVCLVATQRDMDSFGRIEIRDAATLALTKALPLGRYQSDRLTPSRGGYDASAPVFSRDGALLACASLDDPRRDVKVDPLAFGDVQVWRMAGWVECPTIQDGSGKTSSLAFLSNRELASGGGDGLIRVWKVD